FLDHVGLVQPSDLGDRPRDLDALQNPVPLAAFGGHGVGGHFTTPLRGHPRTAWCGCRLRSSRHLPAVPVRPAAVERGLLLDDRLDVDTVVAAGVEHPDDHVGQLRGDTLGLPVLPVVPLIGVTSIPILLQRLTDLGVHQGQHGAELPRLVPPSLLLGDRVHLVTQLVQAHSAHPSLSSFHFMTPACALRTSGHDAPPSSPASAASARQRYPLVSRWAMLSVRKSRQRVGSGPDLPCKARSSVISTSSPGFSAPYPSTSHTTSRKRSAAPPAILRAFCSSSAAARSCSRSASACTARFCQRLMSSHIFDQ